MVLGLYYVTKGKRSTDDEKIQGEGRVLLGRRSCYCPNEGQLSAIATSRCVRRFARERSFGNQNRGYGTGRVLFKAR
jgi:hypothetical protein